MTTFFAPFVLTLALAIPSLAVENLGPSCELSLKTSTKFKVSDYISLDLQDDQILVRGELHGLWETGMEDKTIWSVFDEFYDRKILADPWDNVYSLRQGDRIFILADNGNVIVSGYYKERHASRIVTVGNKSYESHPNRPGLYKDPDLIESVMSTRKLMELFQKNSSAVLVRTLKSDEKERLKKDLGPLLIEHYRHLLSTERYLKLNEQVTVEVAHFETVIQGYFKYKVGELPQTGQDPISGQSYPMPGEMTFIPMITPPGITVPETLQYADELILLDLLGNVIHRENLSLESGSVAMMRATPKNGQPGNMDELLKKLKSAVRAVAIRRNPLN